MTDEETIARVSASQKKQHECPPEWASFNTGEALIVTSLILIVVGAAAIYHYAPAIVRLLP